MTAFLLDRARSGDADAFAELVAPHRRELHVHCYRMLGSFEDADDAVQETLLAAWRGLATFQARASVRTWLYRVATNTCLNLVRTASRRPQMTEPLPPAAPVRTGSETVTWLQPYPDALLDALPDDAPGRMRASSRTRRSRSPSSPRCSSFRRAHGQSSSSATSSASAREVAGTLGSTEEAVAMTLSRARASLRGQSHPPLRSPAQAEAALVRRLAAAFTAHDIDAVVSLLAEDVRISMPPLPAVWAGRPRAAEFVTEVAFRLVPEARFVQTRANRQPALAAYSRDAPNGLWRASGLLVITLRGDEVAGLTRFESHTLRAFGLPRVLPAGRPP
jgi:RNA polymerase sigma-70 factor (TIGR02960 family)